jgi:hypothetical protein
MARIPLRALGLLLLTASISVASCQALFHATDVRGITQSVEPRDH